MHLHFTAAFYHLAIFHVSRRHQPLQSHSNTVGESRQEQAHVTCPSCRLTCAAGLLLVHQDVGHEVARLTLGRGRRGAHTGQLRGGGTKRTCVSTMQ